MAKKCEICAYDDLLDEGGLPAYPIDLLEEVSADPETYRDRLRPWQAYPDTSPPDWKDVFQKQLKRWRDFRKWQVDNRELQDDEHEYHEFLERSKLYDERRGLDWLKEFRSTESEYYEDKKSVWDDLQAWRQYDWFWLREDHGRGKFPGYVEEVKRRLAKHGFMRTFQLDKDPKRQDKLTTWIEYLNYEYSWYDRYTRLFKRLQPKYDEAWQKLVDSGVLRPGETDETLRTTESSFRSQTEEDQARDAVKFAEAAANAALRETEKSKHGQSMLTVQERKRRLARAHSRLVPAKQALKMIMRRNDLITEFIQGTWPWLTEKENIYRHSLLLQWILEHVPVIEAQLNQPKMTESSSHEGRDVETPRRDQDVKVEENRRSARLNRRGQISSHGAGALVRERGPSKRDRPDDTVCDGRSAKRLRSSGPEAASRHVSSGRGIQRPGIPDVERQNEHDLEAMMMGKIPGDRPRNRSVLSTDMPQLPARPPAPRRSARLAARLDSSTTTAAQQLGSQKPQRQNMAQVQTLSCSRGHMALGQGQNEEGPLQKAMGFEFENEYGQDESSGRGNRSAGRGLRKETPSSQQGLKVRNMALAKTKEC
jgi:hypothetical protein